MTINYITINKRFIYYFITILSLILIDQSSKKFLISYLKTQPGYSIKLFPILDIIYAWNYGISFGLFKEYYQYSNLIFTVLNAIIILYLIYVLCKSNTHLSQLGLVFIIGGALGNITDRVLLGAVFDFIYFHYQNFTFPAFNFADSFITIGACFFIYDNTLRRK